MEVKCLNRCANGYQDRICTIDVQLSLNHQFCERKHLNIIMMIHLSELNQKIYVLAVSPIPLSNKQTGMRVQYFCHTFQRSSREMV